MYIFSNYLDFDIKFHVIYPLVFLFAPCYHRRIRSQMPDSPVFPATLRLSFLPGIVLADINRHFQYNHEGKHNDAK